MSDRLRSRNVTRFSHFSHEEDLLRRGGTARRDIYGNLLPGEFDGSGHPLDGHPEVRNKPMSRVAPTFQGIGQTPADAPQLNRQASTGSGTVTGTMAAQGVGVPARPGATGIANPPPVNNAHGEAAGNSLARTVQVQPREIGMRDPTGKGKAASVADNLDFYRHPNAAGAEAVPPAQKKGLDVNSEAVQGMLDRAAGIDERADHGEGAFATTFGTGSVRNAAPGEGKLPATETANGVSRMSHDDMRADLYKRHPEIFEAGTPENAAYIAAAKSHPQGEAGAFQTVDDTLANAKGGAAVGNILAGGAPPAPAGPPAPLPPDQQAIANQVATPVPHPAQVAPRTAAQTFKDFQTALQPRGPQAPAAPAPAATGGIAGGVNANTGAPAPGPIAKVTPPASGSDMDQLHQFANIGMKPAGQPPMGPPAPASVAAITIPPTPNTDLLGKVAGAIKGGSPFGEADKINPPAGISRAPVAGRGEPIQLPPVTQPAPTAQNSELANPTGTTPGADGAIGRDESWDHYNARRSQGQAGPLDQVGGSNGAPPAGFNAIGADDEEERRKKLAAGNSSPSFGDFNSEE